MKQYRFLNSLIFISKLLGGFVLIGGVIVSMCVKGPESFFGFIGSALTSLMLFASGEMIRLFVDIAANVEKMAKGE
ncbi:MAG: hypothetical protein E6713_10405 [Sporomusaceae bacterium]|nr:hypothetical protein [Sporomusaceae bacterium]